MKALFVYNSYSQTELQVIERAKLEMGNMIDVVDVNQISPELKQYVMTTPALIAITEDLQGSNLTSDGTDGNLIVTAMLNKRMEEEDLAVHQSTTHRLDNLIGIEKTKAIDAYTVELLEGGLL